MIRVKKRSNLEDGHDSAQPGSPNLSRDSRKPSGTKSSGASLRSVLPDRKSYSSIHRESLKKVSKRNKTIAEGWKVTKNCLTLDEISNDDSVGEQSRGVSFKFTKKTLKKASALPHAELDEDVFEDAQEIETSNCSTTKNDLNTSNESSFISFVVDSPIENNKPDSKSYLKVTITSEEQPSFKSVLLTSDESNSDDTIENVSSKLTSKKLSTNSDECSTFEVTASVNDISVLPVIDTEETNHTSQLDNFNENSIIEVSSTTSSRSRDHSRKISNKRITFKTDDISMSSSGRNDEMKRRISYAKSPHSKKLNQQYKVDESSYFSSNLIDSKDFDYSGVQNLRTLEKDVIDLTTPVKQSNTTDTIKTSKRKTWSSSLHLIQNNINQGEPQNAHDAENGGVLKPLFASTPFLTQAKKPSPKKILLKPGGGVIKKTSPKKKSPLHKIEKRVIQRTKLPNFKAIHQNALTKMENIVEMKERKAVRAKLLLSGCKPEGSTSIKKPEGKSRKALHYDDGNNDDAPANVVLKPSPSNRKVSSSVLRQATPIALSKPVLRKVEQQKKVQSKIPQVSKPQKNKVERLNQVKCVATKSKAAHNGLDERRHAIGSVRLNRRFDLLMKMRMK